MGPLVQREARWGFRLESAEPDPSSARRTPSPDRGEGDSRTGRFHEPFHTELRSPSSRLGEGSHLGDAMPSHPTTLPDEITVKPQASTLQRLLSRP